ncbi:MAG: GGDEF domain-containing protein [Spirochaetaceae bacterium]|nr:MAG: GGDEF domain-containing protein [Spirochaetaceae bacterium]
MKDDARAVLNEGSVPHSDTVERLRRAEERLALLEQENRRLRAGVQELETRREELLNLLNQDPHTALPIRRIFDRDFRRISEEHAAQSQPLAVAAVRLDRAYDRIRNTRDRGKVFLFRTAARIRAVVGDCVYQADRVDEFVLLLGAVKNQKRARAIARLVVREVSAPHEPPAQDVAFGCHIGICLYKDGEEQREEILGNAYIALEECEASREAVIVYSAEIGNRYRERQTIEKELRRAIQDGFSEFSTVFQPFVDRDGRILGTEALIRWKNRVLGNIPPGRFIPIAEETGDIGFIEQWMLYHSCRKLRQWRDRYGTEIYVSINISPSQFKQSDLVERITGILDVLKLPGSSLKLELTEGAVMENPQDAIAKMNTIRSHGIQISIDDFGIGYSSLNYLRQLPINTLKIDRSFIEDLSLNSNNQEIVKAIISMAHSLKIEALAEGVETREQLDFLLSEQCHSIQGFLFSRPVSAGEFEEFLAAGGMIFSSSDGVAAAIAGNSAQ